MEEKGGGGLRWSGRGAHHHHQRRHKVILYTRGKNQGRGGSRHSEGQPEGGGGGSKKHIFCGFSRDIKVFFAQHVNVIKCYYAVYPAARLAKKPFPCVICFVYVLRPKFFPILLRGYDSGTCGSGKQKRIHVYDMRGMEGALFLGDYR